MTEDQIYAALRKVMADCDSRMKGYVPSQLREMLSEDGYTPNEQDEIIRFCADKGFNYCIDPIIQHKDGEYCPKFATYWGPDQLKSRIQWLVPFSYKD